MSMLAPRGLVRVANEHGIEIPYENGHC